MACRRWKFTLSLALASPCFWGAEAFAQSATVTLSSQKQYIRGFGGMNHAAWAGDLTAAERSLAFGNSDKELGLSALRIPVSDGSPDSINVATAKAAIANGAIVFATPWNAVGFALKKRRVTGAGNHAGRRRGAEGAQRRDGRSRRRIRLVSTAREPVMDAVALARADCF